MNKDEEQEMMKDAVKQALKEWLDSKFSEFGKWSATAVAAAGLVALVYFILMTNGWHR